MAHPATPAAISRVRLDDERTSVTRVNDVRHTPARALSGANVRHPNRTTAIVDRVTFNAHILETGTQSYRLSTSKTSRRQAS